LDGDELRDAPRLVGSIAGERSERADETIESPHTVPRARRRSPWLSGEAQPRPLQRTTAVARPQ